jgi:hypothetical protein
MKRNGSRWVLDREIQSNQRQENTSVIQSLEEDIMQKKRVAVVILAAFLVGCSPSQSPVDIQGPVDTAVAQTMEIRQLVEDMVEQTDTAQDAQTQAAVAATPEATNTMLSSQTPEVSSPSTLEPVLIVSDTPLGGSAFETTIVVTDTPPGVSPAGAPTIHKVTPDRGSVDGGSTVKIEGTNLRGLERTIIEFGLNNPATNVRCTDSVCTVTSPRSPQGVLGVVVISAIVDNVTSLPDLQGGDHFTYTAPVKYACDAFAQKPGYLEDIKAGSTFDIRWIIVNTGENTWPAGFDVKYSNGSKMTSTTLVEIGREMSPNDRYTIELDAVAPKKEGHQYMTWVVEGQLCFPSILINVVK